ncbi:transposase [Streptomyces sp. NPDC048277]|uniref:transposase n=1 Tax=Streptomyces sp. NPDC048277 TaxID=3155027 RepID=UPI0033D1DC97
MEAGQKDAGGVAVLDVGRCDEQVEEQAFLVNLETPLLPFICSPLSRCRDNGEKATGRERHFAVDTRGLPVMMVTPANIHDAHAARDFLFRLRLRRAGHLGKGPPPPHPQSRQRAQNQRLRPVTEEVGGGEADQLDHAARRNCRDYDAHLCWTVMALMTRRLTKPVADWREPKPPPPPPVSPPHPRDQQVHNVARASARPTPSACTAHDRGGGEARIRVTWSQSPCRRSRCRAVGRQRCG